jgi:hypothetical protein
MHASFPVHLILLDLIIQRVIIFGELYMLRSLGYVYKLDVLLIW